MIRWYRSALPVITALAVMVPVLAACGAPTTATGATGATSATAAPAAASTGTAAPLAATVPATTAAPAATAAPATSANAATADRTGWPEKFTVGFFGGDDAEKVLKDHESMRVYLEQKLGMPVQLFTGTSYSAVIEAMRANRVDAMEVGPFAYVLAVQEAQAEALAINTSEAGDIVKYNPNVPSHYYSAIITKKGSGITTLQDLKGKNFAFVDPASTSGHLAPKTLLVKNNINPDTDMKTVFAGSHPTAVLAVKNGSADAGATFEGNLYTLQKQGQIEFCNFADKQIGKKRTPEEIKARFDSCPDGQIAIIAMSDEIPSTPFAIRSNLPASFKATVKASLLAVKDDPKLVASFGQWYTDPSQQLGLKSLDQYYNSLRDIAKLLNLDLKELGK